MPVVVVVFMLAPSCAGCAFIGIEKGAGAVGRMRLLKLSPAIFLRVDKLTFLRFCGIVYVMHTDYPSRNRKQVLVSPELHHRLKVQSAIELRSIKEIVEDALRAYLVSKGRNVTEGL